MQRIAVIGSSGSGKTTTARTIRCGLGIPRLEMNSLVHSREQS